MPKLPHAVLIEGGSGEARMEKATSMLISHFSDDKMAEAKLQTGSFEDLLILRPAEKKKITVDAIEDRLIPYLKMKPFSSTARACIIPDGDNITPEAQNKLLKILEEPAEGDVIIILASNAENLLPTVRSRCIRIWLGYDMPATGPATDDIKKLASALVYGKGTLAEIGAVFAGYEGSAEEAADFLSSYQVFLRNLLLGRYSPNLIEGDSEYSVRLRESAGKIGPEHAALMRKGVLLADKAIRDIERGYRVRYALRGMALSMRMGKENGGF